MTKDYWIQLRKNKNFDADHLYEFYIEQQPEADKVDYHTFQQAIAHYLNQGGNFNYYLKYFDNLYELMFLTVGGEKKIVI